MVSQEEHPRCEVAGHSSDPKSQSSSGRSPVCPPGNALAGDEEITQEVELTFIISQKDSRMKKLLILAAGLVVLAGVVYAQDAQPAQPASMTASLNKNLGIYVFPAKDQKPDQQAKDEQECYSWAVQQSGVDPLNMQATKPDTVAKGPDGSAVKGAAKGAVAEWQSGNCWRCGEGCGDWRCGRRHEGSFLEQKKKAQQEQEAKKTAAATDQAKIDSFKKAYSACLEGKDTRSSKKTNPDSSWKCKRCRSFGTSS